MRLILGVVLLLASSIPAIAQDAPRAELFGGYSVSIDDGHAHGWNASIAGNVNSWLGLVADFSQHYTSQTSVEGGITVDADGSLLSYRFGPRLSHRTASRLTPFAHVLLGGARFSATGTPRNIPGNPSVSFSFNGFGVAAGAGVDVRVNDQIAIRVIQADWDYIGIEDRDFDIEPSSSARISAGVVFRFN